jgi:tetratricopeptide (TPR) repeat protein
MKYEMEKRAQCYCRKIGVFFIFFMFLAVLNIEPVSGSSLGKPEIADLLSQAKDMFRQADKYAATDPEKAKRLYLKSAMRFEKIVKDGKIHNGKLYYNIGNAYFRTRDIGRAILNYRRAMQYIPNDPNLRQNLDFAREKRRDRIEEKQETRIFKTIFFWHYDLSLGTRVIVFIILFVAAWIAASTRIFFRWSFLTWSSVISILLCFLLAGSLLTEGVSYIRTRPGVVIVSEVTARKGNGETYDQSFKEPLHAGTEFNLIEKRGNWYHIQLPDSRECWVPWKSVELLR